MAKKTSFLFAAALTMLVPANANAAANCVRFATIAEYGQEKQQITNTCSQQIHVIWCHDMTGAPYIQGACGQRGRYYQKEWTLQPGESYANMYSLPAGAYINYGACYGRFGSAQPSGTSGSYNCR